MGEFVSLLASFSYALSNVLMKRGTVPSSKNNGAFLSLLITVIMSGFFWAFIVFQQGFPTLTLEGIFWFVVGGVLSAFFGRTFQYSSVQHLGAVRASSLKNLNPFFTVILGIIFLKEEVNLSFFIGMILIFSGLFFMVRQSIQGYRLDKADNQEVQDERNRPERKSLKRIFQDVVPLINIGYIFGVLSALAYAFGFVVRKQGLEEIPDPLFGVLLGGFVGSLVFLIMAFFKERYVYIIKETFTTYSKWLFFAGVAMSAGQILNFFAIFYLDISRAALLITTQTIFSILLSVLIFKTKENITRITMFSIILVMIGAFFIILE